MKISHANLIKFILKIIFSIYTCCQQINVSLVRVGSFVPAPVRGHGCSITINEAVLAAVKHKYLKFFCIYITILGCQFIYRWNCVTDR